ncbi:transposase [Psychrobacter vallis]
MSVFARNQRHESKNCPFCREKYTKKNGRKLGKQQYQCLSCKRQFSGGTRLNNEALWTEYTQGKQTYKQLADKYHCSLKTIQRRLDKVSIEYQVKRPKCVNIIMDTTYLGRQFGLMLFMDNTTRTVLHQLQIVTRYLTRRPKNIASIELRGLTLNLAGLDKSTSLSAEITGI